MANKIKPADEMTVSELLEEVTKSVRCDNEWDLTDDQGDTMVTDSQTNLPMRDLVINKDDVVAVVIPLEYFSEAAIREIFKTM